VIDTFDVVFSQQSAESAICFLGVRYDCNLGRFFVRLGGLYCRFKGLYVLRAVSIILENGGEKFQFLSKGILGTECFDCVYQGGQD
jgi:hypothetical protein